MKKMSSLWLLVLLLVVVPLLALLNGWALSILWGWFIVPLGAPPIGVFHGAGLGILVSLFVRPKSTDSDEAVALVVAAFLNPLVSLAFGYLFYVLMGGAA